MKIKRVGANKLNRLSGSRVARKGSARASKGRSSGSAHGDDVAISSDSRMIGMAGQAISEAPDVRMDRVQPIKEALEAGRYSVASLDVADKILRQVLMERKKAV